MSGLAQAVSHHRRQVLQTGWSFVAGSPDAGPWTPIDKPSPVAAVLRSQQQWSMDGPVQNFDGQDWWYTVRFDAPALRDGERCVLGLDGLATIATVWLNGQVLLNSSNMFVAHECDVSLLLQPHGNTLLMQFCALDTELAVRRKRPRWRAPMIAHQQLRWIRATVLGRTPGWSPPCAVVGPWKDVWLEQRRLVEVQSTHISAQVHGAAGVLKCAVDLCPLGPATVESVRLQVTREGHSLEQVLQGDGSHFSGELRVPEVALWWPHTHGTPALYDVTLLIHLADSEHAVSVNLGQVGFRTITVDQSTGGFELRVNGVPVFCRGACWTPLDPVTLRSSADECVQAVAQVAEAGMNMLRVAGTMVYEEDHFYDACDAMGVLIWQDFMFANMDYPAEAPDFLQSVEIEVRQQLGRMQGRACMAVWCGNSEVAQQASMWGAPSEQWTGGLLDVALAQWCADLAPNTVFWPSSAFGGAFPHQGNVGTTSYYGVGAYLRGFDDARRSNLRFATECLAFANIPADTALKRMPGGLATRVHHPAWKLRSPRDLGAGWDFDDVRDHYVARVFGVEPNRLRYSDHERYVALGRMATGEAMAAAFSEWRRPASHCRGALVLFMRDLWAGAGWGVVDDAGAPKACYHYLKRVLQPVNVLLTDEGGNGLFAHLINETRGPLELELEISAWQSGDVLVATGKKNFQLPAHSAQSISCLELLGRFIDLTYAYRFGPKPCGAVVATLRDASGHSVAQTFYFPDGMDARQEPDVGLNAQITRRHEQTVEVNVSCKRLAIGVHFDVPGFEPAAEYFHLVPGQVASITLRATANLQQLTGTLHAVNSHAFARLQPLDET